ncbi:hypothetical protein IG631_19795 [Alternaria alternata]|nr:hypothetical protein IG631_19795 [Alternaria alternata]
MVGRGEGGCCQCRELDQDVVTTAGARWQAEKVETVPYQQKGTNAGKLTPTRRLGARFLIAERIAEWGSSSLERRKAGSMARVMRRASEAGRSTALRFKNDLEPSASKSTES